jgi:hypothetical protein
VQVDAGFEQQPHQRRIACSRHGSSSA